MQDLTPLLQPPDALIRYYGYYSNAARGKRKKTSLDNNSRGLINQTPIINDAPDRSSCHLSWARLIHLIYEVDPLLCPSCNYTMKIIAFITDHIHIIKILKHLDLWPVQYPLKLSADTRASPLPFPISPTT